MKTSRQRYFRLFAVLAICMVLAGLSIFRSTAWFAVLQFYLAVSFTLLAVAYRWPTGNLLRKNSQGWMVWWNWIPFGPYLILNLLTFRLYLLFTREPAYGEVTSSVYFGRRLSNREAATACAQNWSVLDLTLEFTETRVLRQLPGYRSMPLLDATAPSVEQLLAATDWIKEALGQGPVYVHCAFGHGRSACVIVACLLRAGIVSTIDEGEIRLRDRRPGVRLNAEQREVLSQFVAVAESCWPVAM